MPVSTLFVPELCRTYQRVETTYLVLLSSCVVCNDRIQWAISGLDLFVQVSDIPKSLNHVKTNISHPGFVTAYILIFTPDRRLVVDMDLLCRHHRRSTTKNNIIVSKTVH